MGLKEAVKRLEAATALPNVYNVAAYDLTLLTDAELIGIEARLSKAASSGEVVRLTPELITALERVKR